jgi:enoyl-CoA hydratase/carnithine racemase
MDFENLILEKRGHIAIITLNHPPVNAWNLGLMEDFEKAIDEVENDRDSRAKMTEIVVR